MFSLQKFVLDTIMKMIGNQPDYKVQEYALGWYDKKVLTDEDMLLIQSKIEEKNIVVEEEITEIPVIEDIFTEETEEVVEETPVEMEETTNEVAE